MVLHYLIEGTALAVIQNLLHRERNVLPLRFAGTLVQHHQFTSTGIRQRAQKHAIDHAEDGGVDAYPKRESRNSDSGETRILDENPERVTDILKQHMAASTISLCAVLCQDVSCGTGLPACPV